MLLCQLHLEISVLWRNIPSWNRKAPSKNSALVSVDDAGGPRRLSTRISMLSEDTNVCCSKNLHYFNI
jgi:hypothetical protein